MRSCRALHRVSPKGASRSSWESVVGGGCDGSRSGTMARSPAESAAFDGVLFNKYTLNTFPEPPRMSIGSWRGILTWADRGSLDGQSARVACRSVADRARRRVRRKDPGLKSCGRGSLATISLVGVSALFADYCAPLKAWTGTLAKGIVGNSAKTVHNNRDGRQQETFEQRIKLVVLRFPLEHESSKTPEFSANPWSTRKNRLFRY